jgi:hypothetical protein
VAVIKSASLQRPRLLRVFAAAIAIALSLPVAAQESGPDLELRQIVSIGIGLAHGGAGIEYLRELTEHVAVSGGIGLSGFGGRVQSRMSRTPFGPITSTLYLSAGATVFAWGDRYTDSNGMALLEGGVQLWPETRGLYADIGAGAGIVFGETTRGNRVVPTVRLLLGYTLR